MSANLPKAGFTLAKIAVGGAVLVGLGMATMAYAQSKPLAVVDKVELDRYLGVWYEIARKPMYFQNKCGTNVSATYTLNENGNVTGIAEGTATISASSGDGVAEKRTVTVYTPATGIELNFDPCHSL